MIYYIMQIRRHWKNPNKFDASYDPGDGLDRVAKKRI